MSDAIGNGNASTTAVLETPAATAPESPASIAPAPVPTTETGLETWTVPLAKIDAEGSPFRFRRVLKPDAGIKALAESIESEGLLHPLTVRAVGESFQLVSGFRRHAALSYLARTKGIEASGYPVRVSVLPAGTSDDQALEVSFAENSARKSLDATEKAIAVMKLREEFGKTDEQAAELLRISRRQIDRLKDLLVAPDDVRTAFRDGKFGLGQALVLARVVDPAERLRRIERSGLKRLRIESSAIEGSPAETAGDQGPTSLVPAKLREAVRVAETGDPGFPFRITVRARNEAEVTRFLKYLSRIV